jgi:hypothetical protein
VGAEVKMRRGQGKVIIEFRLPDYADELSTELPELTSILDMALAMFLKKDEIGIARFSLQTGNINAK